MLGRIVTEDVENLSGKSTIRSTLTDVDIRLHNAVIEIAASSGLTKREFTCLAWYLLIKKLGHQAPKFKERGYLKAKLKSLMGEGLYEKKAKLGKRARRKR